MPILKGRADIIGSGGVAIPTNGVNVRAWKATRVTAPVAQGTAVPGGADDGSATSGVNFGATGNWEITTTTVEDFWVSYAYGTSPIAWEGPFQPVASTAGVASLTAADTTVVLGGTASNPSLRVGGISDANVAAGAAIAASKLVLTGLEDLSTAQTNTGVKTDVNDRNLTGGTLIGTAIASPSAPTLTGAGSTGGSTTRSYQWVAQTWDGRDGVPSATGTTTTGQATLTPAAPIITTCPSAVTGAKSYRVLVLNAGVFKTLATGVTALTFTDDGSVTPSTYTAITVPPGGEGRLTTVQANAGIGGVTPGVFIGLVPSAGPTSPWVGAVGQFGIDSSGYTWTCISAGTPGIWVAIGRGVSASVATQETTASTTLTDLATAGPTVSLTTGTTATLILTANLGNNTNTGVANMGFQIGGASVGIAGPYNGLEYQAFAASAFGQISYAKRISGLTAGLNTFTAKYAAAIAGTAQFSGREISVTPS